MMHPNHKFQIRLQLIKRLLNTPNCESIVKCILTLSDNHQQSAISYNAKLSLHLSSLLSLGVSKHQLSNNDREIVSHLSQILNNVGFNYKAELHSIASLLNKTSSSNSAYDTNELTIHSLNSTGDSTYLLISPTTTTTTSTTTTGLRKNTSSSNLSTQLDKELDDEIIKIYYKSRVSFGHFLDQYDRLIQELSDFSCNLTNQVVLNHSNVRKLYLQGLKNKLIKSYDVKQKWMQLIEYMTHERCLWYDPASSPSFYILDQTEGPNRERRRTKKSHLYIGERFFKAEAKGKLLNEKNFHPLRYLLNNYEDYVSSQKSSSSMGAANAHRSDSTSSESASFFDNESSEGGGGGGGSFMSSYVLNYWKNSEILRYKKNKRIMSSFMGVSR
jgi:hypothetical protein